MSDSRNDGAGVSRGFARVRPAPIRVISLTVLPAILAAVVLVPETRILSVTAESISVSDLPPALDGLTILHLSDLHGARFGPHQDELLRLVSGRRIDLILLTGDFIDERHDDFTPTVDLIEGLHKILPDRPMFFVPGNHDWWSGGYPDLRRLLAGKGVRVLENDAESLSIQGEKVWVVGVDDPHTGRSDLDTALKGVDETGVRVLMAHAPAIFPEAQRAGIDLLFVGHTHGGQIRLPLIGALWVPGQGPLPRYSAGVYREGGTPMFVNRGLGVTGVPLRFLSRPEVAVVTLRSGGN